MTAAIDAAKLLPPLSGVTHWVDGRFGLIRKVDVQRLRSPHPDWWIYTAWLARSPPGMAYSTDRVSASGISINKEEAAYRAFGEAVERYSALTKKLETIVLPMAELPVAESLPICAPDEPCPPSFRRFPSTATLTCVLVEDLATGDAVPLPAGYVDLTFRPAGNEPALTLGVSTGFAYHSLWTRAVWTGLCEVAERDALMLTWWRRRPAAEVDCSGSAVPPALRERIERTAVAGLVPRFFDMTTDFFVPTVLCLLIGDQPPYLTAGTACSMPPADALAKALDEAVGIGPFVARSTRTSRPRDMSPEEVHTFEDHALFYATRNRNRSFDFLLRSDPPLDYDDFESQPWWSAPRSEEQLRLLAQRLGELELQVLWTDVTAPEARSLGHVVKVTVPQMVPLSPDHNVRWLGTRRLLDKSGLKTATASAFNPDPHPLA